MRRGGLAIVLALAAAVAAQASDSQEPSRPKFDIDPASLPSVGEIPPLVPDSAKTADPVLSGLDLGGSKLNFESDRRPPVTQSGAETIEPGTMMSRKTRKFAPTYFGLSIKTPIE